MVRGPNDRLFISGAQKLAGWPPASKMPKVRHWLLQCHRAAPVHWRTRDGGNFEAGRDRDAFVRIDTKRNLLVLAGTQMQIDGWLDIITTFDIDQLAGTSVGIFPITRGAVEDVFVELEHILNTADGGTGGGAGRGLASMVRVLPVERLNSILVVSPRAAYIETVGRWVEQLDGIDEPASRRLCMSMTWSTATRLRWPCC